MWLKIKDVKLVNLIKGVVVLFFVTVSIASISYTVFQNNDSTDSVKESKSDGTTKLCSDLVKIGTTTVEKDPAGDPEAWLRFDYTTTAKESLDCQYTITFYNSQQEIVRTIPNVEDTFQSPSGQIYNGYSSTPYQEGMTARVAVL